MSRKPRLADKIKSYLGLSSLESVKLANAWNKQGRMEAGRTQSVRLEHDIDGSTLWVHGPIGSDIWTDGIDASAMIQQVDALIADNLTIRVHSPGGDAFDGIALAGAIRRFGGKSTAIVDGLAASAASVITAAADEVIVGPESSFMIHRATGFLIGNADDAAEFGTFLNRLDGQIASILGAKSGQPADEVLDLMSEEFWAFGEEIVESKFADVFDDGVGMPPGNRQRWNLSQFKHVPDEAQQCHGGGENRPITYPDRAAAAALELMEIESDG